ncbi:MAG: type II toxin-antitoxin system RelE/ParE family toxin [Deltaproteobacteria bacterium]|nr:type II toxin-antitoxin system RelE/ParE family toxin [Deltaproteobacteria bacterium]
MTPPPPPQPAESLPIRLTRIALDDLAAAIGGIDDHRARRTLAERFRAAFRRMQAWPHSGRVVPERASLGYKEIIVAPFRVVYAFSETEVQVLRIWHGRRDMGAATFEPELDGGENQGTPSSST